MTNSLNSLGVFKDFSDGTIKNVLKKKNNEIIETTFITNKKDTDVFCVPTHHFCSLGCKMCHLTNKGLNKEMKKIEYCDLKEAILKTTYKKCSTSNFEDVDENNSNGSHFNTKRRSENRKALISFMGVGEPLLNLNLIEKLFDNQEEIMKATGYTLFGYALATMMPNENIIKLSEMAYEKHIPIKVHFSLHSPFDNERFDLLPGTNVNVERAFCLLDSYRNRIARDKKAIKNISQFHESSEPVEIHYTLIQNVNDSEEHLHKLIELSKKYYIPIKFIRFNPIGNLKRSKNIDYWIETIKENLPQLRVVEYAPPGREIGSSCGEFTKHYYHYEIETENELKEFREWEQKHKIED